MVALALLVGCPEDPTGDTSDEVGDSGETDAATGDSSGDETGDTESGDTTGESGDTDTGGESTPEQLPTPTGTCPAFTTGNVDFAPADIDSRTVKLWAPADPSALSGAIVIYWHAYTSAPDEANFGLGQAVIAEIVAEGGVVAAPYAASDVGQFPWFVVNGSSRQDDMLLADEIIACALELGADPRRIHTTGMSAGGIQTSAFSMARSRYLASAASYSGGTFVDPPFDDPDNKFAAMIVHGGPSDVFGGTVNFEVTSNTWYDQLRANGNFAFLCDHGGGHTLPPDMGDDVWRFFQDHPYATEPSPYASGLPEGFSQHCAVE